MGMNLVILWASFLVCVVFVLEIIAHFRKFCEICAKHYFFSDVDDAAEEMAATSTDWHGEDRAESTVQKAEECSAETSDNESA